jgi:lipoprotein-anchoring transpeptidase ErfK/SrfK
MMPINLRRRTLIFGAGAFAALAAAPATAETNGVPRSHGESTMQIVAYTGAQRPGTIIISNADRTLLRVLPNGRAELFNVSIGRPGFEWTGTTVIQRRAEWPGWRPPSDMRSRDASLPEYVPPGPYNPLGARALYLYANGRDTLYRIHGTNNQGTIGSYETSGCFRMTNRDVMDLFEKVPNGTRVIVY